MNSLPQSAPFEAMRHDAMQLEAKQSASARKLPSFKAQALKWLSMREYTPHELAQRLERRWFDGKLAAPANGWSAAQAIEDALTVMQQKGFLSESRAAEAMVNRRAKDWGQARLQMALRSKGVSDTVLRELTQDLRQTELARAQALWQKKFASVHASALTPPMQAKQMRFLLARGFSAEVVRKVVPKASRSETDHNAADEA